MCIQEEIDRKTIAIAVSTTKMTGRVLQSAMRAYLHHLKNKSMEPHKGKQTLKQLIKSGASLANIEVTDRNIKSFESVAKKYKIDYALKKDNSQTPPKYIVFFKANNLEAINWAFNEYSKKQLHQKPSLRKALSKMKELAKTINPIDKARRKEQEHDR